MVTDPAIGLVDRYGQARKQRKIKAQAKKTLTPPGSGLFTPL
jgi:hypothetical protein